MRGEGDVPGAVAYHADLTTAYGMQYVWRGRVTSVIGQGLPPSLRGIAKGGHPIASAKTLAKELVKTSLGRIGHHKYRMHGPNDLIRDSELRDGTAVIEFMRSSPFWGGVSAADTAGGLARVVTVGMLNRLLARRGFTIIYTHLGKVTDPNRPFNRDTQEALRTLARYQSDGQILVTTTRKLLGYYRALRECSYEAKQQGEVMQIDVRSDQPALDLQGLTFYLPVDSPVSVTVNGRVVSDLRRNPTDASGCPSVSIPWRRLEFPDL